MTKFINDADRVAAETVEGFLAVHGAEFVAVPGTYGVAKRVPGDKVAVVSGGGSGHEPVWLEYIGTGFADAVCQGDVFAAPPPNAIVATARAVERGHGVLFVYGNYAGDALNFDMAAEELQAAGIPVRTVRITDDLAAAPAERADERRGIAGGFFTSRIAGSAAEAGLDLEAVYAVAARANAATRSIGVASAGGTIPGGHEPTFTLPDGQMEIGLGMHGEPGVRRGPMLTADEAADQMMAYLVDDHPVDAGERVCVLVNGLGATTRAELYIIARRVRHNLDARGLHVHDFHLGNYATSQEMHGFSISVLHLDAQLQRYYDMPARASFFIGGQAAPAEVVRA
ncbi:dihydroxyacetone kinase subunit DhaK [Phytoactinopolyspora halotolerans]|uniref:Dihydroxyacetone kinase subunit DhaK n=1 Tax=Phytoactinopolyspora halotolerans TaxID=1981512 RepID=A0A6L9SF30_9ACTN|nr:dihydroxyacetone kinase subunit DhaK [Phytoactinopolyspora halotolerans]NEE03699.1 dihydroxyacetone kinase subunit DhaK [Phytoactinopolyspora halotolerans]